MMVPRVITGIADGIVIEVFIWGDDDDGHPRPLITPGTYKALRR